MNSVKISTAIIYSKSAHFHFLTFLTGHYFALDDFYNWNPSGMGGFVMKTGSATQITDFDGWMLRDWWRNLKGRYGLAREAGAVGNIARTDFIIESAPEVRALVLPLCLSEMLTFLFRKLRSSLVSIRNCRSSSSTESLILYCQHTNNLDLLTLQSLRACKDDTQHWVVDTNVRIVANVNMQLEVLSMTAKSVMLQVNLFVNEYRIQCAARR